MTKISSSNSTISKVLTAGGAGNPNVVQKAGGKRRNRRKRGTTPDPEIPVRGTTTTTTDRQQSGGPSVAAETTSSSSYALEYEQSPSRSEGVPLVTLTEADILANGIVSLNDPNGDCGGSRLEVEPVSPVKIHELYQDPPQSSKTHDLIWLFLCFIGIMFSFVAYGLLLEYTTSGGRKLHELSFLFVTSGLYTVTAAAGRYVRGETPTTIPPARFAILGLTSMASTFTSIRSLRYVIYPIQVLAKSCKPVPVMLMGTLMGKRYDLRKYINVVMIVSGVALFMGGGDNRRGGDDDKASSSQLFGIFLLFLSLCFDGGTGAYEDKLMSVHSVQPFDLMYNIQLGKTILAGVSLLVLNQLHIFVQMCHEMGLLLVALGLTGALGQVFIFVTIAKFGALTCSIIGLARKITTLLASIYFYGHHLNGIQVSGLVVSVAAMIMNFMGKSKKGGGHGHGHGEQPTKPDEHETEEMRQMLAEYHDDDDEDGDLELSVKK